MISVDGLKLSHL